MVEACLRSSTRCGAVSGVRVGRVLVWYWTSITEFKITIQSYNMGCGITMIKYLLFLANFIISVIIIQLTLCSCLQCSVVCTLYSATCLLFVLILRFTRVRHDQNNIISIYKSIVFTFNIPLKVWTDVITCCGVLRYNMFELAFVRHSF